MTTLPTNMDPLDDLEDPTEEEDDEQDADFDANLASHVLDHLAPDVPGAVLDQTQLDPFVSELGGVQDKPAVDSPCPKCGAEMEAAVDPASLLSFPMRYIWRCSCGHEEARHDRHIIDNPGADAALDGLGDDDLF